MIELAHHFYLALRSFGPLSSARLDNRQERGGMQLHDAVGVNCKNLETGTWYMG